MSITYFHKAELFLWTAELFLTVLYILCVASEIDLEGVVITLKVASVYLGSCGHCVETLKRRLKTNIKIYAKYTSPPSSFLLRACFREGDKKQQQKPKPFL